MARVYQDDDKRLQNVSSFVNVFGEEGLVDGLTNFAAPEIPERILLAQ
jgi:hypothetical protein